MQVLILAHRLLKGIFPRIEHARLQDRVNAFLLLRGRQRELVLGGEPLGSSQRFNNLGANHFVVRLLRFAFEFELENFHEDVIGLLRAFFCNFLGRCSQNLAVASIVRGLVNHLSKL